MPIHAPSTPDDRRRPRSELPNGIFRWSDARRQGVPNSTLYRLRDAGVIEQVGRGAYRRADEPDFDGDPELLEIALKAPRGTLCLATALARHGLTDEIPATTHVAIPRGSRVATTTTPAIQWHVFDAATFELDRDSLELTTSISIGIYGPKRCIVDAFRLRHLQGDDTAIEALKRWLRRPDYQPTQLLELARSFPKAEPALRRALEILL